MVSAPAALRIGHRPCPLVALITTTTRTTRCRTARPETARPSHSRIGTADVLHRRPPSPTGCPPPSCQFPPPAWVPPHTGTSTARRRPLLRARSGRETQPRQESREAQRRTDPLGLPCAHATTRTTHALATTPGTLLPFGAGQDGWAQDD